ncbi:MAG: hypothetical protein HZA89_01980 [Verrucomicrobia bacterium]|nr:hypothetical protein [Verrucomicrobiota bacterium]
MDIVFNCPNCKQELAVEDSAIGQEIECPSCREVQLVPDPKALPKPKDAAPAAPLTASEATAAALGLDTTAAHSAHKPRGLSVPQHSAPSEVLIKKAAAREVDPAKRQLRIKCIKRISCTSVGNDRFDEVVAEFIAGIGDADIVSINPISYGFVDGTGRVLPDYGVMIVYKG